MSLFSGQGPVFWANRTAAGNPSPPFQWFGNAPAFVLALAATELTHKESYTGLRAIDARIDTELNVTATITVDDFKETNMKLATRGGSSQVATATVTDETVLSGVPVTTELYALNTTGRVTDVTLEDNGSPIDASTYTVDQSGIIQFTDVSGLTGPITASYTKAAARQVGVFKTAAPEIWTRIDSKNTATNVTISGAQDYERAIVDIFRLRTSPAQNFGLINDEFGQLEIGGSALSDATKAQGDPTGQFARFIYLDPPVLAIASGSASPSRSPSASTSPSASASPST